jgi:hypothetical protein
MTTRANDHDAIVRVVQLYIDAFNDNDVAKFQRSTGIIARHLNMRVMSSHH